VSVKQYPAEVLATQPIGFWTGTADRAIVAYLRRTLAKEQLTLPQWWSLHQIAAFPGRWTWDALAVRLAPFACPGMEFGPVFAGLVVRGWADDRDGTVRLTPAGDAGFAKARARMEKAYARIRDGITEAEFVAAVDVLRRMVDNVGEDSDLL
jgi:hypothetical protein